MSSSRSRWLVVLLAAGVPLLFAAFTQHAWEDYFITLRSSRNLVEGHGLVFTPGERVHTFTSPLGVLLPALCTFVAGPGREELALWLFRIINLGFLAAAGLVLWRRAESLRLGAVGGVVLLGLIFTEPKLVDFSMNGMETALLVFFALLFWSELERPEGARPAWLAAGTAGLMWTRPDAFVLAGAMLVSRLLLRSRTEPLRTLAWPALLRGLIGGGLLYAPWFAWAWWYYGTPVPHTVIAKGAYMPAVQLTSLLRVPFNTLTGQSLLMDLFMPAYWPFGGWPPFLQHLAQALAIIAAFAWLLPFLPLPGRRASLAVFIGMFYLCSIILFPWYAPPWTALAAIAIAFTADGLFNRAVASGHRTLAVGGRAVAVTIVALQAGVLGAVAWQMRTAQTYIETETRHAIGDWLRRHAQTGDTLFLEPLGYVGYYSQLKTYDFPGLSSPEVVAAGRHGARRYADIIGTLRPTWVLLRPSEAARPEFATTGVLQGYEVVKEWNVLPQLDRIAFLPGRAWVEGDARFMLFRRRAAPAPATSSAATR